MDWLLRFPKITTSQISKEEAYSKFRSKTTLYTFLLTLWQLILAAIPYLLLVRPSKAGLLTDIFSRVGILSLIASFLLVLRIKRQSLENCVLFLSIITDFLYLIAGICQTLLFKSLSDYYEANNAFWGMYLTVHFLTFNHISSLWYVRLVGWWAFLIIMPMIFVQERCLAIYLAIAELIIGVTVTVYLIERTKRQEILSEQLTMQELASFKQIIHDITEGILIVDLEDKVLYSNSMSNCSSWWDKDLSLESNFAKVPICRIRNPKEGAPNLKPSNCSLSVISASITSPLKPNYQDTRVESFHDESLSSLYSQLKTKHANMSGKTSTFLATLDAKVPNAFDNAYSHFEFKVMMTHFQDRPTLTLIITNTTQRDSIVTLQDNNNYKNRLLASVSHELRTPLNSTINLLERAVDFPEIPSKLKKQLILPSLGSSKILLSIINDILDFSQINSNAFKLRAERKDVNKTIKDCVELFRIQAEKKGIELVISSKADLTNFCTDHHRLGQIVVNLVSNAIKFTFKGRIEITVEELPVFLGGERTLKITVTDTGIGINDPDKKKLVRTIENLEFGDNTAIQSTGVGLGLVVSNELAKRLNPEKQGIQIKSEQNQGSQISFLVAEQLHISRLCKSHRSIAFSMDAELEKLEENSHRISIDVPAPQSLLELKGISEVELKEGDNLEVPKSNVSTFRASKQLMLNLPSRRNSLFSDHQSEASPLIFSQTCRCPSVLVVDDDVFNISALEGILQKLGVSSTAAFNGKEALRALQKREEMRCSATCKPYGLIFMDCTMPVMDGYEATVIIKEKMRKAELREVPIVACTALVQESDIEKAVQAGMDDYCTKPITLVTIQEILKKYSINHLRQWNALL